MGKIDIIALWELYLRSGQFLRRFLRALPMFALYIAAIVVILPLIGDFPRTTIRGNFPFHTLMSCTILVFLFLTFFVIDAILLHEGFLRQLEGDPLAGRDIPEIPLYPRTRSPEK